MRAQGVDLLVSAVSGIAVAVFASLLVQPTRRLAARVRPYTVISRSSLGRAPDVRTRALSGSGVGVGAVGQLLSPIVGSLAQLLGRLVEASSEEAMSLKLRQAGFFPSLSEDERLQEYRIRQLGMTVGAGALGVLVGAAVGSGASVALLLGTLGLIVGGTRSRAGVDRAVQDRRDRMKIEIYTINQLLAMRIRAGGGVVQAVQQLVERASGAVAEELDEALRLHRSGLPASEAFGRIASITPEAHAARTYTLLAAADERGADLGDALLALSEDVREGRREAMRRKATKQRAAMLVPTIAILAPVMLLFVAAPLPSIIFGNL